MFFARCSEKSAFETTVQKYNFFKYENKKNEKFFPNYNHLIINYYKLSTLHFPTTLNSKL